jgi:hypothetical protein
MGNPPKMMEIHGKSTKNDGKPWENPPHGKSLGKMLEHGG